MPAPRETAVIVHAARLYYEQGLSQSEVARALELSRSNVSRILGQARERGIVEITIHDPAAPPRRDEGLEQQLRERFALRGAIVVDAAPDAVARAGAAHLRERIPAVSSVGVSWGQTVQAVIDRLEPFRRRPAPAVLPLVGGLSALDQLDSGDSVLRVLAQKLGAAHVPLFAPAILETAAASTALRGESSISTVLARAADVQLALVGIGSAGVHSSPRLLAGMRLSAAERARVHEQRPAGDVCGRFVTADGRPLGAPTSERVIAVTLAQLARIPEVIGVAAGIEKAPGVAGVLRARDGERAVLDTLVADAPLARAVLETAP